MPFDPSINFAGAATTNVGFQYPRAGANSAAEYMASGLPYSKELVATSASVEQIDFPFVTSEIYLRNNGSNVLAVGWTENGVQGENRHLIGAGESMTFRIRVKSLFLFGPSGSANTSVTAALTMISKRNFSVLSGSAANPDTGEFGFASGSVESVWGYEGIG